MIAKNSKIQVRNGVLPPDHVNSMDISRMRSTLRVQGISCTTRATSTLGAYTVNMVIKGN
ncbi:MAG: hypothetical protein EHM12_03470 [Dehalococcoidia bacterium]|nr:MAG: hypothetical protein EHM12_03470 [Dehalococcoidia bacterium]